MNAWEETVVVVASEPDMREPLTKMRRLDNYEIFEAFEAFSRIVGIPSILDSAPESYRREFETMRRRFNRSAS
jgi:hypothetical protein